MEYNHLEMKVIKNPNVPLLMAASQKLLFYYMLEISILNF